MADFYEIGDITRNLIITFTVAASDIVWEECFKNLDFNTVDFNQILGEKFDDGVDFLQDKPLDILCKMLPLRLTLNPPFNLADAFEFFNLFDPLEQIRNNPVARSGLRYALRSRYNKWLEDQETEIDA